MPSPYGVCENLGFSRNCGAGLEDLQIPARPDLPDKGQPEVFVSFAWGDDSSEDSRRRTEIVNCLCETLTEEGWTILRDSRALRPGELISGFMTHRAGRPCDRGLE